MFFMRLAILMHVFFVFTLTYAYANFTQPIADETIVYKLADPKAHAVYAPTMVMGDNRRIIAAFNVKIGTDATHIYTSDDGGKNWSYCDQFPSMAGCRLFKANGAVYLLGQTSFRGDLGIAMSKDDGESWTEVSPLTKGQHWHASSSNTLQRGNYIYAVLERNDVQHLMKKFWDVSEFTTVLMRGDIREDLTKPSSWTFSSSFPYCKEVEDKEIEYFGIPFFKAYYPGRTMVKKGVGFPPIGWLEANVIQITDPDNYWYDPTGKTFHIFSRAHTGRTNFATVIKAVEQSDGSIKTMFEKAPSGEKLVYTPFPGGQMKFFVDYDEVSKLYWLVSTQSTDSMTKADRLPEGRHAGPDNERRRLQLSFSKNMIDWCFAGIVAIGKTEKQSRHYACMCFDNNDILILSRSADENARSAHDGNLITLHRVKDFRELVY